MEGSISGKEYIDRHLNGWSDVRNKEIEELIKEFPETKFTIKKGDRVVCVHTYETLMASFTKGKVYMITQGTQLMLEPLTYKVILS